jgi:ethanolamine utilization microcompartment shell protein EutS
MTSAPANMGTITPSISLSAADVKIGDIDTFVVDAVS